MIVPDANLLLYAYNLQSPLQPRAACWWAECLAGQEPVGLASAVIFAFVRISTHPRAFAAPRSVRDVSGVVRTWLARPGVRMLAAGEGHALRVMALLEECGTAGNLVTDAHLAVLATENDGIVHTADADFARFPGVRWRNPISAASALR